MSAMPVKAEDLELDSVLRQIEAEPRENTLAREHSAFDNIAGPFSQRLVLFGAGPLGKAVLAGLRAAGVEPLAFADNNQKLWGYDIAGLRVLSPGDAIRLYRESACFVVTIYQGSRVRRQLASMGCAHVAPFVTLLWKYSDIFIPHNGISMPHSFIEQADSIRRCYSSLADEKSKRQLCEQLLWRCWLDYSVLSPADDASHTYFPMELLWQSGDDVFVDCGAFDGDSLRSFNEHWNGEFRQAFVFEPDPMNRCALAASIDKDNLGPRTTIMPFAVGDRNGFTSFECTSSAGSHLVTEDEGVRIECRRLDDVEWSQVPTYIKMDIEGAEPNAIAGASELLRRHQPILAVCTYHRSEHLWQIPNLIRSIAPEYNVFLRRYAEECWEGVCYAIPQSRLKRA